MIQLLQTGILNESLIQIEWGDYTKSVAAIHLHLERSNSEMTGWLNSPIKNNVGMVNLIQQTSKINPFDQPGVLCLQKENSLINTN